MSMISGLRTLRRREVLPPGTEPIAVTSADAVPLRGVRIAGPAGHTFVIGHGMTHSIRRASTRRVITAFAAHGTVIALDFRGHGASGGRSSAGGSEVADIDAAMVLARERSDDPVTVVGFSMGGAVALRQAVLGTTPPDVVVAVSAPSRWFVRESSPMRRVHWLLEHPLGGVIGRRVGIRIDDPPDDIPETPLETVGRIAAPLLLVQGDADHYVGPSHGIDLRRASHGHADLWLEHGMGHAETATSDVLVDRIARWAIDHA